MQVSVSLSACVWRGGHTVHMDLYIVCAPVSPFSSARSAGARICGHALAFQVVPACVDTCVRANVCVCVCVCVQ